ncbi:Hypothetical protein NGAL_HAMBI2427_35150 [Neorhizobium galegae bv. orientalis]|uniref:Uncharacterized protein n=1 Tax=Neorhizobium galegae bv. orientalis str. HAMBI 540 TaxID=1028800 RepID=A0A068SVE6_NEOGA|nr:Hypothetical protein RG540_CH36770 [Neorhizobium galegae bv. orientalis str. HAMBI 540]CDZ50148.1 Hypothetical protein NGAL_HAMBI2427_35150 [Neorhizobium galegae bv. orientalis]
MRGWLEPNLKLLTNLVLKKNELIVIAQMNLDMIAAGLHVFDLAAGLRRNLPGNVSDIACDSTNVLDDLHDQYTRAFGSIL